MKVREGCGQNAKGWSGKEIFGRENVTHLLMLQSKSNQLEILFSYVLVLCMCMCMCVVCVCVCVCEALCVLCV